MSILSRLLSAPNRLQPGKRRFLGIASLAVGGLLMGGTAAYYGLSLSAYAQFNGLARTANPAALTKDIPAGWESVKSVSVPASAAPASNPSSAPASSRSAFDGPSVELYPAVKLASAALSPATSGNAPTPDGVGMQYVNWDTLPRTLEVAPPAVRIQIPAIAVDSKVVEVGTVWKDGVLEWEIAKWAVGHHKGTANPGELGNIVMSGHISSPLLREGEVFKRLPEIPKLLDAGQAVDIIISTDKAKFLYRVVGWELVKPEALDVFAQTAEPTVTLITCYPDYAYWDRLIIRSRLVAMSPLDGGK
ncbi:MAG: sortase [Dehalococcoidia bacterium]|nr:sortase [Dehalococcoidia bacterium]